MLYFLIYWAIRLALFACYVNCLWNDVKMDKNWMFGIDLIVVPVGVIRGFLYYIGVI